MARALRDMLYLNPQERRLPDPPKANRPLTDTHSLILILPLTMKKSTMHINQQNLAPRPLENEKWWNPKQPLDVSYFRSLSLSLLLLDSSIETLPFTAPFEIDDMYLTKDPPFASGHDPESDEESNVFHPPVKFVYDAVAERNQLRLKALQGHELIATNGTY